MVAKADPLPLSEFDYELPSELIAQCPTENRDGSRLLVMNRSNGALEHRQFTDLVSMLTHQDVLVVNNTKVIPARLRGRKLGTTGAIEILLIEECETNSWWVMLKPGKRVRAGTQVELLTSENEPSGIQFEVLEKNEEGHCKLLFQGTDNILENLEDLGEVPLPPYIEPANQRDYDDQNRYQTVYATHQGSVAAPTAGLHFSPDLLSQLSDRGVEIIKVTLHVGLGTFAPVKADHIEDHTMHSERYEISPTAAERLTKLKAEGRRIIAVGTTSVRVLESAVDAADQSIAPTNSRTNIFIYPPYSFRFVDALITNFHLPKSTLLMLISAMAAPGSQAGIQRIRKTYSEAIAHRYRFFSYGDAMFIQ